MLVDKFYDISVFIGDLQNNYIIDHDELLLSYQLCNYLCDMVICLNLDDRDLANDMSNCMIENYIGFMADFNDLIDRYNQREKYNKLMDSILSI